MTTPPIQRLVNILLGKTSPESPPDADSNTRFVNGKGWVRPDDHPEPDVGKPRGAVYINGQRIDDVPARLDRIENLLVDLLEATCKLTESVDEQQYWQLHHGCAMKREGDNMPKELSLIELKNDVNVLLAGTDYAEQQARCLTARRWYDEEGKVGYTMVFNASPLHQAARSIIEAYVSQFAPHRIELEFSGYADK